MARTLAEVQAEIDALKRARSSGALRVRVDFPNGTSRDTTFRSIAELIDAIALAEKELAGLGSVTRTRRIHFQPHKGL